MDTNINEPRQYFQDNQMLKLLKKQIAIAYIVFAVALFFVVSKTISFIFLKLGDSDLIGQLNEVVIGGLLVFFCYAAMLFAAYKWIYRLTKADSELKVQVAICKYVALVVCAFALCLVGTFLVKLALGSF